MGSLCGLSGCCGYQTDGLVLPTARVSPCGDTLEVVLCCYGAGEVGDPFMKSRWQTRLATVMTLGASRKPHFAPPHGHISLMPGGTHAVHHLLQSCRLDIHTCALQPLTRASIGLLYRSVCMCVCVCVCAEGAAHLRVFVAGGAYPATSLFTMHIAQCG